MTTQSEYHQRRIRVAAKIVENEQKFDMKEFGTKTPCGTKYCVAGWTAKIFGKRLVWENGEEGKVLDGVITDTGLRETQDFARDVLGLRDVSLFYRFSLDTPLDAAEALLSAEYASDDE